MILTMRKQELLDEIASARAEFLDAINGLTPEQMRMPGACGIWSVKDVIAHLTAWESETVTALNQIQNRRVPSILQIEDIHSWNEDQYHQNAARPLEAITADFEGVHRMLRQMIEDLDEQTLFNHRRFRWMEGEPLAYLIQENAPWHEQEHAEDIRAWRKQQGF